MHPNIYNPYYIILSFIFDFLSLLKHQEVEKLLKHITILEYRTLCRIYLDRNVLISCDYLGIQGIIAIPVCIPSGILDKIISFTSHIG